MAIVLLETQWRYVTFRLTKRPPAALCDLLSVEMIALRSSCHFGVESSDVTLARPNFTGRQTINVDGSEEIVVISKTFVSFAG